MKPYGGEREKHWTKRHSLIPNYRSHCIEIIHRTKRAVKRKARQDAQKKIKESEEST